MGFNSWKYNNLAQCTPKFKSSYQPSVYKKKKKKISRMKNSTKKIKSTKQ